MGSEGSPFAALTLIVAPAILTNACSVLILSTSNRLARTVDRARVLVGQIEAAAPGTVSHLLEAQRSAESRAIMLAKALRLTYSSLGGFAGAALASVFGAVSTTGPAWLETLLQGLALLLGLAAVSGLTAAAVILVQESRATVAQLQRESEQMERRRSSY
ncbi:MAG: DUF2721 domain-containing protein [Armatimonadetes bacterium]|nr:DUF2721 domain-containing protein [Armatimonadota bacterium]